MLLARSVNPIVSLTIILLIGAVLFWYAATGYQRLVL